jgi:hypothetical protein
MLVLPLTAEQFVPKHPSVAPEIKTSAFAGAAASAARAMVAAKILPIIFI